MKLKRSQFLFLIAMLSPLSFAQEGTEKNNEQTTEGAAAFTVKVGSMFGRVIETTDSDLVLEFLAYPGSRVKISKSILLPETLFDIEEQRISKTDPQAWMKLAEFAQKNDLHGQRMLALSTVIKLDPTRAPQLEASLNECKEACTKEQIRSAKAFQQVGELTRAKKTLVSAIEKFAGCAAQKEASALLSQVEEQILFEERKQAALNREQRKIQESSQKLLRLTQLVQKSEDDLQQGRQVLNSFVKASNWFLGALAQLEIASRRLEKLTPKDVIHDAPDIQKSQEDLKKEIERLRLVVRDDLFQTHLELGQVYLSVGNRPSAYKHAGHAASMDSTHPAVISLRQALGSSSGRW